MRNSPKSEGPVWSDLVASLRAQSTLRMARLAAIVLISLSATTTAMARESALVLNTLDFDDQRFILRILFNQFPARARDCVCVYN